MEPIAPEWEQRYSAANVYVRRLEPARVRPDFLAPSAAVLAALRDVRPDVVIADDWRGLAFAALRARQVGRGFDDTAFVIYAHGPSRLLAEAARKVPDTVARFGEEVAEKICIELADAVVSPSAWLLEWMREHRWPVPGPRRSSRTSGSRLRSTNGARSGIELAVERLAFFGELREGKGIGIFIDSVCALDPALVDGKQPLFLGRESKRWTADRVREALGARLAAQARFETGLDRSAAIRELLRPGTLVVLPTLLENSPYSVAECLEHGIPFVASRVGGLPELVSEADADRVLTEPTAAAFSQAIACALSDGIAPRARPTAPDASRSAWLRSRGRARTDAFRRLASCKTRRPGTWSPRTTWFRTTVCSTRCVRRSRRQGRTPSRPAVRLAHDPRTEHLFLGDPGALGLVENHYGVVGLVRRALLTDIETRWPLFARLALGGARVVSIPDALATHSDLCRSSRRARRRFGGARAVRTVTRRSYLDLPQLTATLAAASCGERRGSK